jgi:DNA-binding Lrp family transcriptional regulator
MMGEARERDAPMVNAIVLLKVKRDRINGVAQELVDIAGVSEVYSVAGQFDLVAILRAKDDEEFARIVTEGMLKVEGIKSSETLIAFRAYSRHDLERMFSVGLEGS